MKLPESVKGLLRTFAPTVVAALSGPFAPLAAGLVTAALKQWLPEGTERATPAQIVQAVDANVGNAALLADLKAAEKALTDAEKDLGFRFAELEQKDRSDARAFVRDSGLARAQFIAGMLLVGIALFMLFGIVVGCVLAVMGTINVDPSQSQITIAAFGLIGTITGIMQGLGANVVGFYWGSSSSSALKNERIGDTMRDLGEALSDRVRTQPPPAPLPLPAPPVVVAPVPPVPVPVPIKPPPAVGSPSRFVTVIDDLFESEGGYVDNPKDPGGCTSMGITIGTLKDWRGEPVTCDDVRALSRDEASKIYFAKYWNALVVQQPAAGPGLHRLRLRGKRGRFALGQDAANHLGEERPGGPGGRGYRAADAGGGGQVVAASADRGIPHRAHAVLPEPLDLGHLRQRVGTPLQQGACCGPCRRERVCGGLSSSRHGEASSSAAP